MNLKMKIFNKSYIKKFILFLFFASLIGCSGLDDNLVNSLSGSDVTAPSVSISSPGDSNTFGVGTLIIQGSAADDLKLSKVEISVDGGDFFEANTLGLSLSGKKIDWVFYLDLNGVIDGSNIVSAHTISARAVDIWDNAASTEISINVDNTLPAIPVAELSNLPKLIGDGTDISITVGGEDVVAYRYKLDDDAWTAEIDVVGNPTISVSGLEQGEHTLLVAAKSGDGVWQDPFDGATEYSWIVNTQMFFTAFDDLKDRGFGVTSSISSDAWTFVVGAQSDDDEGAYAGAIYIYQWNGNSWTEKKITSSDCGEHNFFGHSVSISSDGNTIAVGAEGDDDKGTFSGSLYIYKWNESSWAETKLTASDGSKSDYFGTSVSIASDGNTVVVGAMGDDDKGDFSGSVYIYKWNGNSWEETKLTSLDGAADDRYGATVTISSDGNTIGVGAPGDDAKGEWSGSAYIYQWDGNNWVETKFTASDGAGSDQFGINVSISSNGDTILIGANFDDDKGDSSGSAYVFKWNGSTWDETKLTPSDGAAYDMFGNDVSISSDGNTILVNSYNDDDKGESSGAVYLFKWNGSNWMESKITPSNGAAHCYFGYSVSNNSDGSAILVGSHGYNGNTGAVYLFYP
ncbi:MAG: hypothetical protein GY754_03050 [bacterium]|nr:hypothetical protein [bacterium]